MKGGDFSLFAPAKINPVLEVLSKRPDGFHELALVFQTIGFYDEISFREEKEGIRLEVLESPEPLAQDGSNLVVKAGELFIREILKGRGGVSLTLKKKIPLAAGMGGGSSDAAAALIGLDRLFATGLGPEKLSSLASALGSDVPFFLTGGTALGTGRGEKIEAWAPAPEFHLVLVKPREGLATSAVYQSGKAAFTSGEGAREFRGILELGDLSKIAAALFNGLEPAAFFLRPEILEIKKKLLAVGCLGALVSGSGPTVFGLAGNAVEAGEIARRMEDSGWAVFVSKTVPEGVRER